MSGTGTHHHVDSLRTRQAGFDNAESDRMSAWFNPQLRPVDLLLMAAACLGAASYAKQTLTHHDYQPNESPAAHFPVVVRHAEQGKPVMKVVLWNQLDDYRREPAFTLDPPAGPLDAAKPRRERAGASVTGNVVSEGAAKRVTLSDDDGNNVYGSVYRVSNGRLTPVRHEFHNQGVLFYMLGAGVAGALVMGVLITLLRLVLKRRA